MAHFIERLRSQARFMGAVNGFGNMDKPRAISVKAAVEKQREKGQTVHDEDVHHILRQQFPELRRLIERQIPPHRLQALREVKFGKSELPLSDFHYMKKLMGLGDSVCRLVIGDELMGTGFMLFHTLILTNAHLVKGRFVQGSDRKLSVTVEAQFNYEDPTFSKPHFSFKADTVIDIDFDMDYAVLIFGPDQSVPPGHPVPPGLLRHFGPKPERGEVCIIGHPGGGVKKLDLTVIIEKEKREESANHKLEPYDDNTKMAIVNEATEQGIEKIMSSDLVITYDTFMFSGSSGSPVFDANCRVVGLHSAGFVYGSSDPKDQSIIEFAHPTLDIFKKFVQNVTKNYNMVFLVFLTMEAQDNPLLMKILEDASN